MKKLSETMKRALLAFDPKGGALRYVHTGTLDALKRRGLIEPRQRAVSDLGWYAGRYKLTKEGRATLRRIYA